jgi:chromosome segregation ATPase
VTAVRPRQDGRVFAAVRALKLRTRAQVNNARDHAIRRDGRKFVLRPRAIAGESLRWCINGGEANFDLWGCFQDHKKTTGARERRGSAIMLHMLFIISPEWVCRAGGLHDRENPRNIKLFEQAIACARKEIGGVVAARLDLDEMGGAVVDVFCSPVSTRSRTKKNGTQGDVVAEISPAKALKAVHARHRTELDKRETGSLQNMWAGWAQTHLDRTIERGERAVKTGRVHLETVDFKLQQEALAAMEASLTDALENKDEVEREIIDRQAQLTDIELQASQIKIDIEDREARIVAREQAVEEDEADRKNRWLEIDRQSDAQEVHASDLANQQANIDAEWDGLNRATASLEDKTQTLSDGMEALRADRQQLNAEHVILASEYQTLLQQQRALEAERQKIADDHTEIAAKQLYWETEYDKASAWFETEAAKLEMRQNAMDAADTSMVTREIQLKDAETSVETEKNRLLDLGRDVQMYCVQAMSTGNLLQNSIERSQAEEQSLATQMQEHGERVQMLDARERTIIDRENGVDALVAARLAKRAQELEEQAEKIAEKQRVRGRELDERNATIDAIIEARRRELELQADERTRRINAHEKEVSQNEADLQSRTRNIERREAELDNRESHFAKVSKALAQLNAWLSGGNLRQKSKEFLDTLLTQPKLAAFVERITTADQTAAEAEVKAADAHRKTVEAERKAADAIAMIRQREKHLEDEKSKFEAEKRDLIAENRRVSVIMVEGEKTLNALANLAKRLEAFFPANGPVGKALVPVNELLRRAGNILANYFGTNRDQGRGGRE